MRLNTSTSLFVASSLFCLGSSLPFFPQQPNLEPRATYSVVPVDGGAAATTNTAGQGEVTIVQTVIETPAPTTETIVKTDTLPPTTNTIISTKTVEGPKETQTVDITLTPSATPVTVTATQYSVVDISAPTTIVLPPTTTSSQASTNTAESASNSQASPQTPSAPAPSSTTVTKSNPTVASAPPTTTAATNIPSTLETSYISPITPLTSAASVSSTSYDNGQWHTTYPTWSNGTATLKRAAIPLQTTTPLPTGAAEAAEDSGAITQVLRFFRRFSSSFKALVF